MRSSLDRVRDQKLEHTTPDNGADPQVAALPRGTVTFLLTDIEGSTRMWEAHPDAMEVALTRHNQVLTETIESRGGVVVTSRGEGDSFFAIFTSAAAAVEAAGDCQIQLSRERWSEDTTIRVRMGLHTGDADLRDGGYRDHAPINRCARLKAAAHGGQTLVSKTTRDLAVGRLGGNFTLEEQGEYRLRDLDEPERIYQLGHPDLRRDFPPLNTVQGGNLPLQLTSFVGREREVAAVIEALDRARFVTLVGPGGVGKTRLSIEVAGRLSSRFPDGCWSCELAPATEAENVAQILATALDVAPRQGKSLEASIVEHVRSRRMLLLLDNCEHMLPAAASIALNVLRSSPGVRVLATSRQALRSDGEYLLNIGTLAQPAPGTSFADLPLSDAVRLFVDRAVAVQADFELDKVTGPAVADITRHLDGIPLAIELAAARVEAMSALEIAERLEQRFQLLTDGGRTAAERHQTLRATLDWSYSLLTQGERELFARAGVFAGSFDAEAATAVAGFTPGSLEAVNGLTSLVAKSMVMRERGHDGRARYRLLETLRQYATDRLEEAGDLDARRRDHGMYYATLAERAARSLFAAEERRRRVRIEAEMDNLRAAVAWAMDSPVPEDARLGLRIAAAVAGYAFLLPANELASLVWRAMPRVDGAPPHLRSAILGAAAFSAFQNRGDVALAEKLGWEAVREPLTPECPSPAMGYCALVMALSFTGRPDEARHVISDGTQTLQAIGAHSFHRAQVLQTAAVSGSMIGDTARARECAAAAVELARVSGNPSELAGALWARGITSVRDDPEGVAAIVDEAIATVRAGANGATLGHTLALRAQLSAQSGDMANALRSLEESIAYSHRQGDMVMLTVGLDRAINVLGRADEAELVAVATGVVMSGPLARVSILSPDERKDREIFITRARSILGDGAFDAATGRGAAMPVDRVAAYFLDALDRIRGLTEASRPGGEAPA